MKIRNGFVSNSSSSSYIIRNTTNETKTLEDLAKETVDFIEHFNYEYDFEFTEEEYIESARDANITFEPKESKKLRLGDHEGITGAIGHVADYMFRGSLNTPSFVIKFNGLRR